MPLGRVLFAKYVNFSKPGEYAFSVVPQKGVKQLRVSELEHFFENKIQLWQVLVLIFYFAFEFLNTTVSQLVGVSDVTVAYKKR